MNNAGIRISQTGKDVNECAEHELILTSSAPALIIAFAGEYGFTNVTADQIVCTHNLGYAPCFFSFIEVAGEVELSFTGNSQYMRIDENNLKFYASELGYPISMKGRYLIFFRPLETKYTASDIKNVATATDIGGDYGIKVAKEGYNIYNTDPRNFTIDSKYKMPLIHKQDYEDVVVTPPATYKNYIIHTDLGYAPMFYFWGKDLMGDDTWQQVFNADDTWTRTTSTGSAILTTPYSKRYAGMIMKDVGIN